MPAAIDRISRGRTDLVFDHLAGGGAATDRDQDQVPLLNLCAYYGDVSAIRHLLAHGAPIESLGENLDLNGAAYHGHWRLCEFLIERGADVRHALASTGETALHSALCTTARVTHDPVVRVLLQAGADVHARTTPGAETGSFMRDCRTKGETALHRAAAFGTEETIRLLLDVGANVEQQDAHGDTALSWGSWYGRPDSVLRLLCYGPYRIRADRKSMAAYVLGEPDA
jgi:uncharacterized protein